MDKKILLAVIVKDENDYIEEFLRHHFDLGFTDVIIGDNNDINGEHLEDVEYVKEKVEEGKIKIINIRGFSGIQKQFYNYVIDNEDYEWCAFIDVDEFIFLGKTPTEKGITNIGDWLNEGYEKGVRAFKINWHLYGDSGHILKTEGGVVERFTEPCDVNVRNVHNILNNAHCKSILHKEIRNYFTESPHTVSGCSYFLPDYSSTDDTPYNTTVYYHIIEIRHYFTKSLQEYLDKKYRRGYADMIGDKKDSYPISSYFLGNKITDEKLAFIKKYDTEK